MKHIVIIEDDQLLADMYKMKFELAGYRVEIHRSAELALPELTKESPDLIILDVLLPGKNGLWLLKELHAGKATVPVVILTNLAEADFSMPDKLRESLGVVGYHVKTQVTPADVLTTVQEALV